jgi:hypothetical protein
VTELAAQTAARPEGFKWVLADARYTPDPQGLRDAMHAKNILCGVWEAAVDYGSPARAAQGYDCYVGQVEGPGQYDRLVQSLPAFRLAFPEPYPAAVVTNMGGLSTVEEARPLVTAGFACITETWIKTDGVPPENRVAAAEQIGFTSVQPMAGLGENGATMADYPTIKDFAGYSVFTAEILFSMGLPHHAAVVREVMRIRRGQP